MHVGRWQSHSPCCPDAALGCCRQHVVNQTAVHDVESWALDSGAAHARSVAAFALLCCLLACLAGWHVCAAGVHVLPASATRPSWPTVSWHACVYCVLAAVINITKPCTCHIIWLVQLVTSAGISGGVEGLCCSRG